MVRQIRCGMNRLSGGIVFERSSERQARTRLIAIDKVTAVAITLVVVGHVVSREPPSGNEWYVALKFAIYQFHMPLFMFLSGFIFYYTLDPIRSVQDYLGWCKKKIVRLAPGFLLVGLSILFGKIAASQFMHVDNLQTDVLDGLLRLLITPKESAAGSLWYIYALLFLYMLFPLLLVLLRNRLDLLLVSTFTMHVVHIAVSLPGTLMVNAIMEYSFYFALGCLACLNKDALERLLDQYLIWFVLAFAGSFLTIGIIDDVQSKTVIGVLSIPAMYAIFGLRFHNLSRTLLFISGYTFAIYLLNTIAIGVVKGVMLKFFSWDGTNFLMFFPVLVMAGMLAPIAVYQLVLRRIPFLARIMN